MPHCPECSASVPEGAARCPTCGSALVTTPSATDSGAEVQPLDVEHLRTELAASLAPRYEILKLLGSGGMGAVFLAREPALRRLVAVKILSPYLGAEPRARSRFEREARAAAALSHPNVVRVYSVGETANQQLPYIIMQYVEGATLGQWMAGRQRVAEREARRIIGEVAAALAAAHARELVHRDVKPSNVLVETESGRAFVADFGVSAALSPVDQTTKLTMTGTIIGTPAYMSPEQAAGEAVTRKSDVYSLGLLAYELLTGALPYSATSAMGWAAAHLRDPATPVGIKRPDLSPEVARAVDRCLAKQPADRPDAHDVARALLPSLESEISWPPPGLAPLHRRGRVVARLSLLTAIGGLLAMFALAFTPRILQVHPYWLNRFSGAVEFSAPGRVGFGPDPAATAQFVWQTALILGIAAFAVSLAGLLGAVVQTAGFAVARRRRGWGWSTLLDVAVDHDGRSGLVLAGAREFASLDQGSQRAVLQARRVQTAWEASPGPWVAAIGAAWSAALIAGWISNTTTASSMSTVVWWIAAVPALGCLIMSAAGRFRERRLIGPLVRRPQFEESDADVAAWYASTPVVATPRPTQRTAARALLLGGQVLAVVIAVGLLASLAVAGVAALIAAGATARLGPQALQLTVAIALVDREDPIGTARRLTTPYLPAPGESNDSATTAGLHQLLRSGAGGVRPLPDYHPAPVALRRLEQRALATRRPPPPHGPGAGPGTMGDPTAEMLRRAMLHQIPADTIRRFRALGDHPRTVLFRQLARADHWDLLGAVADRPIAEYLVDSDLPSPSFSRLGEAALANLFGALAEAATGNVAQARTRLGENAAVGLHALRAPTAQANHFGRTILESLALMPLAELDQLQGNARQASELRQAAQRLFALAQPTLRGGAGLAADPANLRPLTAVLLDSRLPGGWRVALMSQVREGICTNPREILLGESPNRRTTLLAAAAQMSDVPHAEELARLATESWDNYLERLRPGSSTGGLTSLLWRIAACLSGS